MLSVFAAASMAVGMGLSYHWVAQAQEEHAGLVDAKGLDRLPPIADVAEKLNPTVVAITNTSFVKNRMDAAATRSPPSGTTSSTGSSAPSAPAPASPRTTSSGSRPAGPAWSSPPTARSSPTTM